jgi:hypothetical protein
VATVGLAPPARKPAFLRCSGKTPEAGHAQLLIDLAEHWKAAYGRPLPSDSAFLARRLGRSDRTIRTWIRRAVHAGLLVVERGRWLVPTQASLSRPAGRGVLPVWIASRRDQTTCAKFTMAVGRVDTLSRLGGLWIVSDRERARRAGIDPRTARLAALALQRAGLVETYITQRRQTSGARWFFPVRFLRCVLRPKMHQPRSSSSCTQPLRSSFDAVRTSRDPPEGPMRPGPAPPEATMRPWDQLAQRIRASGLHSRTGPAYQRCLARRLFDAGMRTEAWDALASIARRRARRSPIGLLAHWLGHGLWRSVLDEHRSKTTPRRKLVRSWHDEFFDVQQRPDRAADLIPSFLDNLKVIHD